MNLPTLDLIVILVYLVGIMTIGILSVRRMKLTGDVYFLAGRSLHWPVIGAALFASNISTIHLVGLAQDGYKRGLVVGNFEWMATFTLILLALVFTPFYFRSRISTLPEFLEKRYNSLARSIMAVMAIIAAVTIHIGVSLYAGSEVFEQFFGIPVWISIVIISTVTAIYTVIGGLRAVVVTETIQTVILLAGTALITYLAVDKLPEHGVESYAELNQKIDVQHSAEALGAMDDVLTAAHLLVNDPQMIEKAGSLVREIAVTLTFEEDAKSETEIASAYEKAKGQLDEGREALDAVSVGAMALLTDQPSVSRLLLLDESAIRGHLEAGLPEDEVPEDARRYMLENAGPEAFLEAGEALEKKLEDPKAEAVTLWWGAGKEIREGEKLAFVARELEAHGFSSLAEVVRDPTRWEGEFPKYLAEAPSAAAAMEASREKVLTTGNMDEYLATEEPLRTPRLSMVRAEGPYFWLAILLGYPILGVWYWCSDQTIVQRVLGAENVTQAQNGALFAGLLKITPVFLMVLPGTVAYVIMRDKIGEDTAKTLPILITELMPPGLMGLMAAALMAALMSTIAAALNSVGTLVAKDVVGHFRPGTSDAAQVFVGRVSAVILMLFAMAWSTLAGEFGTIFEVVNKIPALFLAPPITTVFVWGVFWKRGTKEAAVTTLIAGLSIGFVLFLIDTKQVAGNEWISDPRFGLGIPFMIQAFLMFCIWSALYVIISLFTPAPPAEQVENTTWPNPLAVVFRGSLVGWYDPRLLTIALLALMAVLYWVFR